MQGVRLSAVTGDSGKLGRVLMVWCLKCLTKMFGLKTVDNREPPKIVEHGEELINKVEDKLVMLKAGVREDS